jgi:hypothetical protein
MTIKSQTLIIATTLLMLACNKKESIKNNEPTLTKDTISQTDSIQTEEGPRTESINLFTLTWKDSTDVAFVSLSDIYPFNPENNESLMLPDIKKMEKKDAEFFRLENNYRKRFLSQTNISETDSVFVYDYAKNKLASFSVKNLKTAALLNGYTSTEEWPYNPSDYMIGFEISKQSLKDFTEYYSDVLVYVGKENPFTGEQLTQIVWKKVAENEFPSKAIKKEDQKILKDKIAGNVYSFKTKSFDYFIRDYFSDDSKDVFAHRLIVIDSNTKEVIIDNLYSQSEGTTPAPLNNQNPDDNIEQYTGRLFKNKPPVVFGFLYQSFGCPSIEIIDKSNEFIYLQCDNRH